MGYANTKTRGNKPLPRLEVRLSRMAPEVRVRAGIIKEMFLSGNIAYTAWLYGISRPTCYRYWELFRANGLMGLVNKSRGHHSHPLNKPDDLQDRIVRLAADHSELGYKKIFRILGRDSPAGTARTVQNILKKNKLNTHFLRKQRYQESLKMTAEAEQYC